MKFTEEKLEKAFADLIEQEGFPHFLGNTIDRKADEVLIEEPTQQTHPIEINLYFWSFSTAYSKL